MPSFRWAREGRKLRDQLDKPTVRVREAMGFYGFYGGQFLHLVDQLGLTDPLIARLPAIHDLNWRPGHFRRAIPDGYLKTLRSGKNSHLNPYIKEYYSKLKHITQGDLWDWGRIKAIIQMNLGGYKNDLPLAYAPYPISLMTSFPNNPSGNLQGEKSFHTFDAKGGIGLVLEMEKGKRRLALSLRHKEPYMLVLLKDSTRVFSQSLPPKDDLLVQHKVSLETEVPGTYRLLLYCPDPPAGDGDELFQIGWD